jgi:hypothetical protein
MIERCFNRDMDAPGWNGFESVPNPCDAIGFRGGAIRCITLPLRRDVP